MNNKPRKSERSRADTLERSRADTLERSRADTLERSRADTLERLDGQKLDGQRLDGLWRALAIMNQNTSYAVIGREPLPGRRRRIHLVLGRENPSRARDFCVSLERSDRSRFLVCLGIPDLEELLRRVTEAHDRGWSGDACLFVASSTTEQSRYSVLEKAIDRRISHWRPHNIWLFSNSLPDPRHLLLDRWKVLIRHRRNGDLFEVPFLKAEERLLE